MFIFILCMFREAMCPSSGELIVSIRHLVYVTLYRWPFGVQVHTKRSSIQSDIYQMPWLSRNTNKMQLCNRIYYSKVYWRLNIFRAAHRSSSGTLNCICSVWFIYTCGDRPLSSLSGKWISISHSALTMEIHFPLRLDNDRSPHGYINQRLQIQFRVPDDEQCVARNMLSLQ